MKKIILNLALIGSLALASNITLADSGHSDSGHSDSSNSSCSALPNWNQLKAALSAAQDQGMAVSNWICGALLSIETASFAP